MSAERQRKRIAEVLAQGWDLLVATARAWIADTADRDAEDIVQDVIATLFEKADVTEPIRDISAYIYRSLRNRVVDLYRAPRRLASLDAPADGTKGSLVDLIADERYEAAGNHERAELRERIFAAVEALPPKQRDVFLSTELEGRSFRELAEEWETPIGTLLARKHRAVKTLRASLEGGKP